ncbi:uncharacterized protein LOC113373631 [Ctenocephalides felis]|uniref:uncharacterized protein LOC113373631 n=1 Tax=Ctenocephalides felis TaxID=7515 RepID=UPI000E6E1100|nr:uncharacterized protein LOC113373631 [Ctenocephalides felis]
MRIVPYKGFYPSNALPYYPGERDKELANFRNQTEELKAHYLQQVAVLHSHEDPNSSDENLDGHGKGKGKGKGKGSKRKTSLGYLNSIYDYLDSADVSYESSGIDDSESGDSSSKNYAHHSYHSDNSIEEYDTEDHYGGYHNENYKYDDSRAKDTKPGSLAIGSINTQNSGTEGAYALPNYGEEGGMEESKDSGIESHIHPGDIYVGFSNRRISLTNKQRKRQ